MTRARLALLLLGAALLSAVVTALLVSIFERQQEARLAFRKVVWAMPSTSPARPSSPHAS